MQEHKKPTLAMKLKEDAFIRFSPGKANAKEIRDAEEKKERDEYLRKSYGIEPVYQLPDQKSAESKEGPPPHNEYKEQIAVLRDRLMRLKEKYKKIDPTLDEKYLKDQEIRLKAERDKLKHGGEKHKEDLKKIEKDLENNLEKQKFIDKINKALQNYPQFLVENVEKKPGEAKRTKEKLEKIIFLIERGVKEAEIREKLQERYKDEKIKKDELEAKIQLELKHAEQANCSDLREVLRVISVCALGQEGNFDDIYNTKKEREESDDTLEADWTRLRTLEVKKLIEEHNIEYKVPPGYPIHTSNILTKYALDLRWGIVSDLKETKDPHRVASRINDARLKRFEEKFHERYTLKEITNVLVEKFRDLFYEINDPDPKRRPSEKESLKIRKGEYPKQEFNAQIYNRAEVILKQLNLDINPQSIFELIDPESPQSYLRFSPELLSQCFWQYCQSHDKYVDKSNWQEEKDIFEYYDLVHAKSRLPQHRGYAWLQSKVNPSLIVRLDTHPLNVDMLPEEKIRYYIYSILYYKVTDAHGWLKPPKDILQLFKEEKEFPRLLAQTVEKKGGVFPNLFIILLKENPPNSLIKLLSFMKPESIEDTLKDINSNFIFLHPHHSLHKKMLELPALAAEQKEEKLQQCLLNYQEKWNEKFKKFKADHKIDDKMIPIPYSFLVAFDESKPSQNDQDIFAMYFCEYYPNEWQKLSSKDNCDFIKEFKKAHKKSTFTDDEKELMVHIKCGHLDAIKEMHKSAILKGVLTPLGHAARIGDDRTVLFLLENIPNSLDVKSGDAQTTPLLLAIEKGHHQTAELLLEHGANPTLVNSKGESPYYLAAAKGNLELMLRLEKDDPNIFKTYTNDGSSALHAAAENGEIEVVHHLVYSKQVGRSIIDLNNNAGYTALESALNKGHVSVAELLLEAGTTIDQDMFFRAVENGNLNIVKFLLEQNPEWIDMPNQDGWIPWAIAASRQHDEIGEFLEDQGANKNWLIYPNMLLRAVEKGNLHAAQYLLVRKPQWLNHHNQDGWSALHLAAKNGHIDIVRFLLNKGAHVEYLKGAKLLASTLASCPFTKRILLAAEIEFLINNPDIEMKQTPPKWSFFSKSKVPIQIQIPALRTLQEFLHGHTTQDAFDRIKTSIEKTLRDEPAKSIYKGIMELHKTRPDFFVKSLSQTPTPAESPNRELKR